MIIKIKQLFRKYISLILLLLSCVLSRCAKWSHKHRMQVVISYSTAEC